MILPPLILPPVILVAGPTASGKSGLALAIAGEFGGTVINADSMQVYDGLRILTARPGPEDEARLPHRLYGVLPPAEPCSAGRWQEMAAAACREAWAVGRIPVVVGGTGLYLRALRQGLSPVPEVPDEVRADSRARFAALGNAAFHTELAARDPVMAGRLHPGNSQRLIRAWEVLAATGRSLAEWQQVPARPPLEARFHTLLLDPPRDVLYAACNGRFLAMMERGALAEVQGLLGRNLPPDLPAMKALGVPELAAFLNGELPRERAIARAQQATRNYAKRQQTWFRHQIVPETVISAQFSESLLPGIFANIRAFC